jgi:hypothetical protein
MAETEQGNEDVLGCSVDVAVGMEDDMELAWLCPDVAVPTSVRVQDL